MNEKRMTVERIDKLLLARELASSRTIAQRLIAEDVVEVDHGGGWQKVTKASERFSTSVVLRVLPNASQRFISRAGLKLESALSHITTSLQGLRALDIGQSTGGFSDCLLRYGVERVIGVDVGHNQLHSTLGHDTRVRCIEGVNARELTLDLIGESAFDLVVMDVSFISQTRIHPKLHDLMKETALLVSLVKPQFEVGSAHIGKGGIVKDPKQYSVVQQKICRSLVSHGFSIQQYVESGIRGSDGNREFFVVAEKTGGG